MIEETLLKYLEAGLSVPVFYVYPTKAPDRFVLLERIGGSRMGMIRSVSFTIQSYAATLAEAAQLNEEVLAVMDEAIALPEVSRVDLDSDYEYTDETMKKYRYQAVFDLTLF